MKKLIFLLGFLIIGLVGIMAQDPQPPEDWIGAVTNFNLYLQTLGGIAALTLFVAGLLNKLLKTEGFYKQLVAWLVAIVLAVIGNLLNIGLTAEATWINTIIFGVASGFIANGIFDIDLVKRLLQALKIE